MGEEIRRKRLTVLANLFASLVSRGTVTVCTIYLPTKWGLVDSEDFGMDGKSTVTDNGAPVPAQVAIRCTAFWISSHTPEE